MAQHLFIALLSLGPKCLLQGPHFDSKPMMAVIGGKMNATKMLPPSIQHCNWSMDVKLSALKNIPIFDATNNVFKTEMSCFEINYLVPNEIL